MSSEKSLNSEASINWRAIVDRLDNLSFEDRRLLTFDSIEDAKEFYSCYSKMVGFSIRDRDQRKDKHGIVIQMVGLQYRGL